LHVIAYGLLVNFKNLISINCIFTAVIHSKYISVISGHAVNRHKLKCRKQKRLSAAECMKILAIE